MKKICVEWKGITPLIMNSCKTVNPLHPIALAKREITDKPSRKRTVDDLIHLSDLEWEGSLYHDDDIGLYVPAENIEATVRDGAKARRKGKDIVRCFNVVEMRVPLDIGEVLTLDQMRDDYRFRDVRQMTVQRARVTRTRGRFNMWRIVFTATYDETQINLDTVVYAMQYAGQYVGLCDSRPKYGKFEVVNVTELD